jgi:Fe-S cluster assembly ATPase SufC
VSKKRPFLVIIRGPMGSGKSTLRQALAGKPPWHLYPLDGDAVTGHHPPDPFGEWLDQEWNTDIDILALHAKLTLGRGLSLVTDTGDLLSSHKVERFLHRIGRSREDPRVVLLRLEVKTAEAVRRKATLKPSYVRASHKGWVTRPVHGEVVIETDGKTPGQVARMARRVLRDRMAA